MDLNFSSIMARAPVIGSLMYLLGGHHAREEEEYASSTRKEMDLAIETTDSQISFTGSQRQQLKSAMKKSAPSLAPTDDSDNDSFQSALDCSDRHSEIFDSQSSFRRKKKELSWSDESGQNLVEYMDALPVSNLHSSIANYRSSIRTESLHCFFTRNACDSCVDRFVSLVRSVSCHVSTRILFEANCISVCFRPSIFRSVRVHTSTWKTMVM